MKTLEPLEVKDILNPEPLPSTQNVREDLYWCARGNCEYCSRKTIKDINGDIPEVGGCKHDLLDIASELLLQYEIIKSKRQPK